MLAHFVKPASARPKLAQNISALPEAVTAPAISVIIPMYNAEKYIAECLDSLLAQTFQDFEVIVVNDCSTDNSVEIIESHIPKFDGRLILASMEKNSGGCAMPRNKGVSLSRGEYIQFVDSDDVLTKTALEELYTLAKGYDADVVYCEKYYISTGTGKDFIENIYPAETGKYLIQEPPFVDKPTLETEDLSERVQGILNRRFWVTAWDKFVKRKVLIENEIFFPHIAPAEDDIWTYGLIFYAKKFLRVPNMIYIRRMRDDSVMGTERTPQQTINFWLNPVLRGLKSLDNLMSKHEFFKANPQQRYAILEKFVKTKLYLSFRSAEELSPLEVYETIMNEFGENFGEYAALVSALCTHICDQHKTLKANKKGLKLFKKDWEIPDLKADISLKSSFATPAVSVIIPLYNVEEYVDECLESLLAQTFQDFEVIVVDDCSTDNSVEVVKSYAPKFEGRLTVARMEKNSGGAGFPRNKGIELAHGEYLYFFDPDDTISPTALEELYSAAEMFNAEVVHCEKYYTVPDEFYHDAEYRKNLKPQSWPMGEKRFITQPTLLTDDFEKRVKEFSNGWLQWASWMQFIRRDFLVDNGIRFLNIYSEDMIFTMCELCCAKNYLVVPNVVYYWRRREDSKTTEKLNAPQTIHRYTSLLKQGIGYLDEFLSRQEFFAKRTDLKYILFKMLFLLTFNRLNKVYADHTTYRIDNFLRREFDSNNAFTSFIFNIMNTYRLQPMPKQKRVSVIIPMYNAEKYIGECLDSLLAQTFQDFEVIVVDDCSTDNSVEVVKGYLQIFQGRLTLTKTEQNTGSPGEPTNIGVAFSRGEYLLILDNDDTVAPDALEKLYTDAKKFNADVVACEQYYRIPEESWNDVEYRKNLEPFCYGNVTPVPEPTLIPFDIARRVQECYECKFLWELWSKLIRRDFFIENKLRLTDNITADIVVTCCLAYTAKRFVRVPYAVNYYRVREDSLYHQERDPLQQLKVYLNSLKVGFKYLDDFLSKREFFRKNSQIKYIALNFYLNNHWNKYIREIYGEVPPHEREAALREEFSGDDTAALTEFFFKVMSDVGNIYKEAQITRKYMPYFTGRVDVKLMSTEGDFQILSVSDDKADVRKPDWMQQDGIGYQIQSYAGQLKFVAKANVNGQVQLWLKGINVRDPKDNSKRIPYWIDYTSLVVNGEKILTALTPVWHNKPYSYKMDLKADEEITVQAEWLPHKEGTLPVTEKPKKQVNLLADKFMSYVTARVDVKLMSTEGDFQILSVSDKSADVLKPDWMQKNCIGYQIQSYAGQLKFVAKATADGQINLELKGLDVRDPKDNSKRIPYWIDYTSLVVNGEKILTALTPVWHNKPYRYKINLKAGEELTIQVEWLPHRSDT